MNSKFLLIQCAFVASVFGAVYAKFCSDIDLRGNVSHFEKLAGCKVVVGYLQIVLFDEATVDTFRGITYPELEEITGYFLIFQVPGLLSIGKLFPNLRIIRGMEVIMNYAFMLYNVTDLMEIAAKKSDIPSGKQSQAYYAFGEELFAALCPMLAL
ncbi:putative tyrosine-protein kinase receptor [Trypoxylus dichotomus]